MKKLLAPLLIALLAGCASAPPPPPVPAPRPRPVPPKKPLPPPVTSALDIDRSYSSKGQSSRVKFIIVHYTVSDTPRSIKALTRDVVSSHYLITDEPVPVVYGLVDETRQSNHAGVSNWKNYTLLNGSSIGIEIVNPGFTEGPNGRVYHPFPQAQIDKLIVLMKDIAERHQIPPENVLGHSDIAPLRKQDPGPMFPWWQLANHKLVLWPDAARVAAGRLLYEQQLPDAYWFQQKLAAHGYTVPRSGELDEPTRTVIAAFQMKYRPQDFGGFPDAETAALLEAMNPTPAGTLMPAAPARVFTVPAPARVITLPSNPQPVAPPTVPAPAAQPLVRPAPVAPAPVVPAVPAPPGAAPAMVAPVTPAPVAPPAAAPVPVAPAPILRPAPAPVTPVPSTPAPVMPGTVTPAPVMPAPVAPAPGTPAPVTPAPVTPAPITPAPVPPPPSPALPATPAQAAPAPEAPAPLVPAPATRP